MADVKLYSAQDIEQLKQKIATYRDTLTTLKSGNSIDDYLFMKSELNGFKMQVSQLQGVMERMDGQRSTQVEGYEQQIDNFSRQMSSLNQTVEELCQDLSIVMKKLLTDRPEKVKDPVPVQDSEKTVNQADEILLIEETTQTQDRAVQNSSQRSNRPPSFKQLQSLVGKASDSQGVPSAEAPTVSIGVQDSHAELQHIPKQRFPAASVQPNQIYNGLYRNVNRAPTIHFTNVAKKQDVPIRVNDHSDSNPLPMSEPEKNEIVMAYPEDVQPIAIVEEKQALIIEGKESFGEEKVTLLEEKEALIEMTTDMKRQQHKNKETLSLFSFFRKKH